jgi:SAM-dependent methyltransferase
MKSGAFTNSARSPQVKHAEAVKNIVYQTDRLARYFAQNRVAWQQFYESERVIIDQLGLDRDDAILDIGCGCGGLGLALRDRFGIENYTGVEINQAAAEAGRRMNPKAHILCGDILDLSRDVLHDKRFDVVFSLSCVDWNICFSEMLAAAWNHVVPGGHLVSTFRLTAEEGCGDFNRSYQFINYDGIMEGERASYVVLNAKGLIQQLLKFNPSEINAYGYWGVPSVTAVTPYARLCFAAFSIRKRKSDDVGALRYRLKLPGEILAILDPLPQ